MKKIKNEAQLLKKALEIGMAYANKRGFESLGSEISTKYKIECIYRLLVTDQQITPLAKDQEDGPHIKNKLIIWIKRLLPENHELLK